MKIQGRARLSAHMLAMLVAGALNATATPLRAAEAAAGPLTLADVLGRAAAHDPSAEAARARVDAARAGLRQAGVQPNPTVGVDLENLAALGGIGAFERSEATLYYEQTLERGDKRGAREGVGRAEVAIAQARWTVKSLDLLEQVQAAWVEAQAAEALIAVAENRLAAAERLERDVGRRVAAARDPLFLAERARTAVAQARIALDQARSAARAARADLAAYWGGSADAPLDAKSFFAPSLDAPPPLGEDHPDFRLLAAERDLAGARVGLERSRATPDPRVRGGVRYTADGEALALVVGGSIPLQHHDTNQGAIDKAQAERLAADKDIAAFRVAVDREVARLVARRAAALAEIRRIDEEVLPSADRAVTLVRDGFNRGGGAFTYLEVAEAERAVNEAEARRIDLLKAFHLDGVRLDRLVAAHAPLATAQPESR